MPDRHDTRAWRMLEALDRAPYRNEARLALIEAFLLEERREAVAACGPCHVPECSCH